VTSRAGTSSSRATSAPPKGATRSTTPIPRAATG
jgi:hypothetical protein